MRLPISPPGQGALILAAAEEKRAYDLPGSLPVPDMRHGLQIDVHYCTSGDSARARSTPSISASAISKRTY